MDWQPIIVGITLGVTGFVIWLAKFTIETLKNSQERYIADLQAQREVYMKIFDSRLQMAAGLVELLHETRLQSGREHESLLKAIEMCVNGHK